MKNRNTRRYAVKTSKAPHAPIISSHCTLGEAYKAFLKHHKAHFKNHRFSMAQTPIAIIATEVDTETIEQDIYLWATQDRGPRSIRRLPLPIVVHKWVPNLNMYQRLGET